MLAVFFVKEGLRLRLFVFLRIENSKFTVILLCEFGCFVHLVFLEKCKFKFILGSFVKFIFYSFNNENYGKAVLLPEFFHVVVGCFAGFQDFFFVCHLIPLFEYIIISDVTKK